VTGGTGSGHWAGNY